MKRLLVVTLILCFTISAYAATVNSPGDIRIERNNILPQSNLLTIFSNSTTGESESFGLGDVKIRCHTWTIETDKETADVSWTIALKGSLDDSYYENLDSTTTVEDWKREIESKGANWIKSSVLRTYTGTVPEITIKYQAGCN